MNGATLTSQAIEAKTQETYKLYRARVAPALSFHLESLTNVSFPPGNC